MGLFSKLSGGNQEINLTPQAALLLAACTMVAADGDIDDDEMAIIQRLDGSKSTNDWELAMTAWKRNSISDNAELAASALDEKQQLVTIANLIDIAMADSHLDGAEKDLLEKYVSLFSVSETDIERIVDVISTKNDKSLFI